ncbi:MAG: hypothetical protein HFH93_03020 [Lachnospiraceae bacterium]|nr:hypothetical protein [Lachnospiraceae bacterium]
MKETNKQEQNTKRSSRQIVAIVGVVLLVLLYVVTLITAILDSSQSAKWFRICLFATFALPLVIWIYSWMHGRLTGKSAIGDPAAMNQAQASHSDTPQNSHPAQASSGTKSPESAAPLDSTSRKTGEKDAD